MNYKIFGIAGLLLLAACADDPPSPGTALCTPSAGGIELCDGIDNDCNGQVDEGFDTGTACQLSEGNVVVTGTWVCSEDKLATVCDAMVDSPPDVLEGCVPACAGAKPHCTEDDVCVECLNNTHCTDGVCDQASNTCTPCVQDSDCADGVCISGPIAAQNLCKACRSNTECTGPEASKCDATNSCAACSVAGDCAHLNLNQCDAGVCVECTTATEATDCNGNVCDVATHTCTTTPIGSVTALKACTSDTACGAQARCVPLTFQGAPHGNYCMPVWESGQCPRPYGAGPVERTSVNGFTGFVCMIKEQLTTPEAIGQYETDCTNDTTICTAEGGRCELFNLINMAKRCTYSCSGDSDCETAVSCGGTPGNKYCGAPL